MPRRARAWVTIDPHSLRGTRDWGPPADLRSLPYFWQKPPRRIRTSWEVVALALDRALALMGCEHSAERGGEGSSVARRSLDRLFRRLQELRSAGPEVANAHSPAHPCFEDPCPLQDYVDRLIKASRLLAIPASPALRDAGPRSASIDLVRLNDKGHEIYAAGVARHIENDGIVKRRASPPPETGGG